MPSLSRLKLPWRKNYKTTPAHILERVQASNDDQLRLACVKKITASDLQTGKYSHLGLRLSAGEPVFTDQVLPDARVGRYSQWNVNGRVVVRRDLPKVTKVYGPYEIPIYGDPSRGYCDVLIPRRIYQRETVPPRRIMIEIELLEREARTGNFIFRFRTTEPLNRTSAQFAADLLYGVNLLQENTGAVDLFPVMASTVEYLRTINVDWEILPPGEDTRERIFSLFSGSTTEIQASLTERYDLLTTMSPIAFINGTDGFNRYFGAQFSERLVVFENINYGNAAYVMDQRWRDLSQRSRIDLLKERPDGFTRISHTPGWETRLRDVIARKR